MDKVQKHNLKHKLSQNWWLALPFLVLGIMMFSSDQAKLELEAEQAHYCNMVEEGTWPDYKDTYEESCK